MILKFFQKAFPANLSYRNFIFIPVFFSFYLVLKAFNGLSYPLQNFIGRSISVATSEGIDISNRVGLFYKGILFVFILIILFTRITIILRQFVNEEELKIANGLSIAGLGILYFELLGADMHASLHFIFALLIICLSGFVDHRFTRRENKNFTLTFLWSTLVALSLFFFYWQISLFLKIPAYLSIPKFLILAGVPLYLTFTKKITLTNRWLKAIHPVVYLPILSFLSIELFLILNQHGINLSPSLIYFTGIALIIFRFFRIFYKQSFIGHNPIQIDLLFRRWVPWLLAGIACMALYQPVIQPEVDWFESANNVLPLHQWFQFGKIPFLDTFSSHAFSDFGFGMLYSALNGLDPLGGFVYRFLMSVLVMLIVYLFLFKITGDGFLSIWIVLAYPYSDILIPSYYNFVPLAALSFILLYEKQTTKRYTFFFACMLLMPLWRVDLGLSTLIAGGAGLILLLFFVPSFKPDYKKLRNGLFINLTGIALLILIVLLLSGSHLFISLKDALSYMSSFQSYGLKELAYVHDIKYFSLYFILPSVILLLIFHSAFQLLRKENEPNNVSLVRLSICFLGVFYLANLQRGLVRHTLAEQWDTAFTSYGFFIVLLFILIRYLGKNPYTRFLVFFIVSTVITTNYVFTAPGLTNNNFYQILADRVHASVAIPPTGEKVNRIIENADYKNRYEEFSMWMKNNFPDSSTFLDFSNTPMLYFYTNRQLPNYLAQIPHTAHNDYLQERLIDDLKKYDIPVCVFSNEPQTYWDNLDGIPNTLRHYKISEYIFRNYKPWSILSNHSVWVKKDFNVDVAKPTITVSTGEMILKNIVLTKDSRFLTTSEPGRLSYTFALPLRYGVKKISYSMSFNSPRNCEIITGYKSSKGSFNDNQKSISKIFSGYNEIFIMTKALPDEEDISDIYFTIPKDLEMQIWELKIYVNDYYPDQFSVSPREFSLNRIPFIWGAFDVNYKAGKIMLEQKLITEQKLLPADESTPLDFNPLKNKENGNYFKITARIPSGNSTTLAVSFGEQYQHNGLFQFTLNNDTLYHDYLLRISSQYRWYSRPNSWIRFYPFGNAVEIKEASILKGD